MKDEDLRKYFSDVEESFSELKKNVNKKLEESERPYEPRLKKAIYIMAIILIVLFSVCVGVKSCSNTNREKNADTMTVNVSEIKNTEQKDEKHAGNRIVTVDRKTDFSVTAPDTSSEITYRILVVSYFIVMSFVLFLLVYLMKNDDGGIRFDKLNELHSLRNAFFAFKDMQNLQNEIVEEVDILDVSNIKSDVNKVGSKMEKTSTMNINYNVPCKKTTKHKNVMLDFIKSYMNAISEV